MAGGNIAEGRQVCSALGPLLTGRQEGSPGPNHCQLSELQVVVFSKLGGWETSWLAADSKRARMTQIQLEMTPDPDLHMENSHKVYYGIFISIIRSDI
jgi:hypothetical protein